jgi:hypothetical protein
MSSHDTSDPGKPDQPNPPGDTFPETDGLSGAMMEAPAISHMRELEDEYVEIFNELGGDVEGRKAAQDYLEHSTAIYKGEIIRIGYIPKLFDGAMLKFMESVQQITYRILEKITNKYIEDPEYRKLFGFSPTMEHLIEIPCGYDCTIPIGRFDIFLNEKDMSFKFCEFNTDGASAMNEDRESANALSRTPTFEEMSKRHRVLPQELFNGWVKEFINIYESYERKVEDPQMAIVDFSESASVTEFQEFQSRFDEAGMRTVVVWMDQLEYREADDADATSGPGLYTKGGLMIDVVYRRAVSSQVADAVDGKFGTPEEQEGARAMVKAFERGEVCLIGSFKTQVAHCKQIFRAMHHPLTSEFLTPEERDFIEQHVPYTAFLVPEEIDIDMVKREKDDWIVKPDDGFGSSGVYAGVDYSQEEWEKKVDECTGHDHIVQSYCKQYPTLNCKPKPIDEPLADWNNLVGYYNYGGKFGGLFNRAGQSGLIVGYAGGITVPTFLVDCDLEELGLTGLRTREPLTN